MASIDKEKKDKRVSIYGPRSPLAKQQGKQFDAIGSVVKPIVSGAKKVASFSWPPETGRKKVYDKGASLQKAQDNQIATGPSAIKAGTEMVKGAASASYPPAGPRKPVYDEGTPLQKAQDKQLAFMGDIVQGGKDLLTRTFTAPVGREGVAHLAKGTARGFTDAVLPDINATRALTGKEPLSNPFGPRPHDYREQMEEQRVARGVVPPKPDTSGMAMAAELPASGSAEQAPQQQTVADQQPPPDTFRTPHQGLPMSSDGFAAYTGPDGKIRVRMDKEKWNKAGQRVAGARRPAQQDSGYAIDNQDPTNDVAAFNRDPVRPTAQIARSQARGPARKIEPSHPDYSGARGARKPDLAQLGPEGGWGWNSRIKMYNAEQDRELERSDQNLTARGQDVTRRGQDIDAQNVAGQNKVRDTEIQGAQFDLGQKQELADLQQRYAAETDPAKRKQLENEIYARMGKPQQKYQVVTEAGTDPLTDMPYKTPYIVDSSGTARRIGGGSGGGGEGGIMEIGKGEKPPRAGMVRRNGKLYYFDGEFFHDDLAGNSV